MLNLLPPGRPAFLQEFNFDGAWVAFTRPNNVTMLLAHVFGGAGGGAGGLSRVSGQGPGGGGGQGGGMTTILIPWLFLPDTLWIWVGSGGAGGAAGSPSIAGGAGSHSYIAVAPDSSTVTNIVAVSGSAVSGGGGAASTGSSGAAGTGSSAATAALMPLCGTMFTSIAGQAGTAGGFDAVGGALAIPATGVLSQGGGGGGGHIDTDTAGNVFTAIAGSWLSEQLPQQAAAGTNGKAAQVTERFRPLFHFGGGGGSASAAAAGVAGGDGAHGSGGGGGGSGNPGGKGGNGGEGLVVLIGW